MTTKTAAAAFLLLPALCVCALQKPNYDESKIAPYTLEDPLVFADGRRVASPADWPARRKEILDIFAREMYGQPPPPPEALVLELAEEKPDLAGQAIRRQYKMWFKADKSGPCVEWLVYIPNRIKADRPKTRGKGAEMRVVCENEGKVPAIIFLNYRGNHEMTEDRAVKVPSPVWVRNNEKLGCRDHKPSEETRLSQRWTSGASQFPVETIVARGYAVATACYGQVSPDINVWAKEKEEMAWRGVFGLWPARDPGRQDGTTALGAWAWAISRGVDMLEKMPEIDGGKIVATGCSRLGKAALLAAARDERIAVCVPNQTGGGGVPLAKRNFGENVAIENYAFPHWYCHAYRKYSGKERTMKFDQHLLVAAIAPRRILVQGFNDKWFDAKGEWLSCRAASPAWRLFGLPGLPGGDFPESYSTAAVGTHVGYVRRGGEHGISGSDWAWTLDFADRAFGKRP